MNPGFSTGVPEIDRMLRGILAGDNVVWRVDRVVDYAQFLTPYCRYGLASDRPVVYFRFAAHPPLIAQGTRGVQVVSLNPSSGFEPFLDAVHDAIEATPKGGYYVFDILSELAAAWYSDQMLCNFFLLTCPYLYDRGDLAYFALLRDRHSNEAVFPIRETCQVMIDVYRRDSEVYLRPIKTQFRHSPTMHLLHQWQEDALIPITSSHRVASVLRPTPPSAVGCAVPPLDDWNRTFLLARDIISGPPERSQTEQAAIVKERLLRMIISRDERAMMAHAGTFDFILDAVSANHDVNVYLSLLKRDGHMVLVGLPAEPLAVGAFPLISGRKSLSGSMIGGIGETQQMLDFCAAHGIVADIELIPIQRVNEAYERTIRADVKYRFVIDLASLK